MTSTREYAIVTLFGQLRCALPDITILRNVVVPTTIPSEGLIILRDGDMGEPSMILSPPRYTYHHQVELEVIVQRADSDERDQQLDELLVTIGTALKGATQLDNSIDWLTVESPSLSTEPVEGAATLKAATVLITLEYVTDNPLL